MTARKAERLMNLVILLLVARHYTSKEQIRELMEPYRTSSTEAFERMFERDKDELRALGIPLETGSVDKFFDDEPGYRIKRDAFELPPLEFAPDEVAVLGLAARVWRHAGLASAASEGLLKLKAAGIDVDREQLDTVQPTLTAQEPAFEAIWSAALTRTPVRFDYRRGDQSTPETRHLQPWGLVTASGRWYVAGHDLDRGQPRVFRLSRVVGDVATDGEPGSFTVPEGTDLRALSAALLPAPEEHRAVVLARRDAAIGLRRRAETLATGVSGPDELTAWDRLELRFGFVDTAAEDLLGYADTVVVEEPDTLRSAVRERLAGLAGEGATP